MRVAVPGRHLGQTVRKGVLRTWDKRRPCAPRPEFPFHLPAASLPRVSTLVLPAQGKAYRKLRPGDRVEMGGETLLVSEA